MFFISFLMYRFRNDLSIVAMILFVFYSESDPRFKKKMYISLRTLKFELTQ